MASYKTRSIEPIDINGDVLATYNIIKRIRKRMQMKANRLIQTISKEKSKGNHGGASRLLLRAHTWQNACLLMDQELEALEWQMKKSKRT